MEKQAPDFKRVRKTVEEVAEMFRNYVSPERYEAFVRDNQSNFKRISCGNVSDPLTLNNNKNSEEYIARVQGILKSTSPSGWEKLDCVYKQKELIISDNITLGGEKIVLSEDQKTQLLKNGRIDEVVQAKSGSAYYVAVDKDLNRMTFGRADKFRAPKTLHDVELTDSQREGLQKGNMIKYEREYPLGSGTILELEAYYDPTLRTIRSHNVLDQDGKPVIKSMGEQVTQTAKIENKVTPKVKGPKREVKKTSTLTQVETAVKTKIPKTKAPKIQTKGM